MHRHPVVRDLAWLIGSPPLMGEHVPGLAVPPRALTARLAAEAAPWLDALDDQPAELQEALVEGWMGASRRDRERSSIVGPAGMLAASRGLRPRAPGEATPRIGHYAERLMEFWLARHPGVTLLAARRAVRSERRDLGDLDVVFRLGDGQAIHWELSVKFYLRARRSDDWDAWIGPNPRDRLDLKLGRVIGHQLPLGGRAQASASAGLGAEAMTSQAFLKGWLFMPAEDDWRAGGPSPRGAAPDHGRGWWLRHEEQEPPQASRASRYLLPDRLEWMSPQHRPDDGSLPALAHRQLRNRLERHFARRMAAVLVCEVQRDEHGWWREVARGFVVHPRWPEIVEAPE